MRLSVGALVMMTAACAAVPPGEEVPEHGASGYSCNADDLGELVGQPATSELGAEALRRSGARALRWIRPGDAVTMDYREDRLNVKLDAENKVEGFTCG